MKLAGTEATVTTQIDDDKVFEQLFKAHYKALHAYAYTMLHDADLAEEIIQNMFLKLWEKRELLKVQTSVKAYLYKCVYNDALNHLKHEKIKDKYHDHAQHTMSNHTEPASHKVELTELERKIKHALNELPEQCRTVFQLSRFEELKYKEIAEHLGISIKTVENQMSKALKIMRANLAEFITLVLVSFTYLRDFLN